MSYFPATLLSIIVHGVLIFLIVKGWGFSFEPEPIKPPAYIKATLLDLKNQSKQQVAPRPKPEPKPIEEIKPDPAIEKQELEKQRLQEQLKKQKQIALEKAEKEKKKQKEDELKKKKQEEERKKKLKQERELKEKQKREAQLKRDRERLEAEMQSDLLAEQAAESESLTRSYISLIKERIEQNWSRPPSARNDMQASLTIQMVPTGEIIDVVVRNSSGNQAYDRSAIQAVKKTARIPELKNLPNRVFEKQFRQFTLEFKPQDLRQ